MDYQFIKRTARGYLDFEVVIGEVEVARGQNRKRVFVAGDYGRYTTLTDIFRVVRYFDSEPAARAHFDELVKFYDASLNGETLLIQTAGHSQAAFEGYLTKQFDYLDQKRGNFQHATPTHFRPGRV